ncbi:MAG: DNA translocase FtsK 4TM domain-containing protein [Patescibacteria group bacterium]
MGKKKKKEKEKEPFFSSKIRRIITGLLLFLFAMIGVLSAFDQAGEGGSFLRKGFESLFGGMAALVPLLIFISGWIFIRTEYEQFVAPLVAGFLLVLSGATGFFTVLGSGFNRINDAEIGGIIGSAMSNGLEDFLGRPASLLIFSIGTLIGLVIFWNLLYKDASFVEAVENFFERRRERKRTQPSVIKKIFAPSFETKKIEDNDKEEKVEKEEETEKEKSTTLPGKKLIPPVKLLEKGGGSADPGDTKKNSKVIQKTFSNFDIDVDMSEINVGPTVTQYTLKPAEGIKLSKITSLSDDLALSLAKHPVRTEAPIPGKSLVGIEVPNEDREMIRLGDLLGKNYKKHDSDLTLAVGKDVSGNEIFANLAKMPHLLVAGATGSGKTIFLNTLILSLIYKNSPEDLRLILVDPKRVEFSLYKRLPHLLTSVIYDAEKTNNALQWLIGEMERRFDVLSEAKKRNIGTYNDWAKKQDDEEVMPYIVLVVDELADLMAKKQNEIESGIVRIAQMARAVGIHLILATQRPSVEVITGLIKANITSRVSFQVASQVDSRTILDMGGAERLLGAGDMLFVSSNSSKPKRVQGPFVSEEEVKEVVNWLVDKAEDDIDEDDDLSEDLEDELEKDRAQKVEENMEEDELYEDAKDLVIRADKASASMLQRKLRIGYVRAARILDMLEARNIVGPSRGSKPRVVYGDNDNEEDEEFTAEDLNSDQD